MSGIIALNCITNILDCINGKQCRIQCYDKTYLEYAVRVLDMYLLEHNINLPKHISIKDSGIRYIDNLSGGSIVVSCSDSEIKGLSFDIILEDEEVSNG